MAATKTQPGTKKARRQFVKSDKWQDYINKKYPGLLGIYQTQPEIAQIIRQGYIQDMPAEDINANLQATDWYRNLGAGEFEYVVKTATGDQAYKDIIATRENQIGTLARQGGYTISPEAIRQIAADSLKGRWGEDRINQAVSTQVTTEAQQQGQTPAPAATPTGLQLGRDAASIRASAKSYGLSLNESQVEGYVQQLLRNEISPQQVADSFRNQAKSLYPALAAQLDTGNLDSSVASYRSIASQVLGVDPTQVDFTDPKYQKLLTYKDPDNGQSRLMNATEWGNYLRTLPEWKKTAEAATRYDGLLKTIDDLFGKVR